VEAKKVKFIEVESRENKKGSDCDQSIWVAYMEMS
jgi:hypothetical protein